jgi:hypothetical protein
LQSFARAFSACRFRIRRFLNLRFLLSERTQLRKGIDYGYGALTETVQPVNDGAAPPAQVPPLISGVSESRGSYIVLEASW